MSDERKEIGERGNDADFEVSVTDALIMLNGLDILLYDLYQDGLQTIGSNSEHLYTKKLQGMMMFLSESLHEQVKALDVALGEWFKCSTGRYLDITSDDCF